MTSYLSLSPVVAATIKGWRARFPKLRRLQWLMIVPRSQPPSMSRRLPGESVGPREMPSTSQNRMKSKDEEVLTDQQVCNQERSSSLKQEDPEPPQIKEEQEVEHIIVWTGQETLRLLDTIWKPEIKIQSKDISDQKICKEEEVPADQQVCNHERISSLDQEDRKPPEFKEDQEKPCTSQEGEQLLLKDTNKFMVTSTYEEPEPSSDLLSNNCPQPEWSQDQEESESVHSGSTTNANTMRKNQRKKSGVESQLRSDSQCNPDTSRKSVKCEICGKTFQCKYKLTEHLRVHTGEKPYSCSTCGKGLIQMNILKTHMRIHTGEKPYSCSLCGKKFCYKPGLETHMRTHTGEKPCSCSACGKSFRHSSALTVHMRIHTGGKPYLCGTCGKGFSEMYHLKSHMRIHTGEKPYSCSACGKSFRHSSAFRVHMRIHTGEKPYSCSACGKSFRVASSFGVHMRSHTGEKPYCCSTCGKGFSQMRSLKIHMRIHTGEKPYSCSSCGKKFTNMARLKTHMRNHTGEKPHLCNTCGKTFSQMANLKRHMRIHSV